MEKQRTAGAVYQKTKAGKLNHKVRQEQYRARLAEKVTHHGDLGTVLGPDLVVATLRRGQENPDERREESPKPPELSAPPPRRCDFCGRPCECAVRTALLVRLGSIYRRGPRLPGHIGLGQRR